MLIDATDDDTSSSPPPAPHVTPRRHTSPRAPSTSEELIRLEYAQLFSSRLPQWREALDAMHRGAPPYTVATAAINQPLNTVPIYPCDDSRVVVRDHLHHGFASDYVNASYVRLHTCDDSASTTAARSPRRSSSAVARRRRAELERRMYVASSAPTAHYEARWWHAVCQQGARTVVMLCEHTELPTVYYPLSVGDRLHFTEDGAGRAVRGDVKVSCRQWRALLPGVEVRELDVMVFGDGPVETDHYEVTRHRDGRTSPQFALTHTVTHYAVHVWPDRGTTSLDVLSVLVDVVLTGRPAQYAVDDGDDAEHTAVWVHCRAGVGRTGTLYAAASIALMRSQFSYDVVAVTCAAADSDDAVAIDTIARLRHYESRRFRGRDSVRVLREARVPAVGHVVQYVALYRYAQHLLYEWMRRRRDVV